MYILLNTITIAPVSLIACLRPLFQLKVSEQTPDRCDCDRLYDCLWYYDQNDQKKAPRQSTLNLAAGGNHSNIFFLQWLMKQDKGWNPDIGKDLNYMQLEIRHVESIGVVLLWRSPSACIHPFKNEHRSLTAYQKWRNKSAHAPAVGLKQGILIQRHSCHATQAIHVFQDILHRSRHI